MEQSLSSTEVDFSLVLACYCEEPHLFVKVGEIHDYLSRTRLLYEIIFVEDCSPDGTKNEVNRAASWLIAKGVSVQTIFHGANCGRGASVQDGFQLARGKVIAYLDVDLENPIDALLPMYSSIVRGECDGVVAKRLYQSWRVNPVRLVLSLCYKFLVRLIVSLPVSDSEAGFKMFLKEKILPVLPTIEDRAWFWDTEIVARAADAGLKLKEHPIVFVRDPTKASTVRVVRDSYVYLRRLIAFSWRRGDRLKSAQDRLTRLSVALAKRKR